MSPSDSRQATQALMADIQKDDGSMTAHELISAYATGPSRLRDTLTHLTAEQLRARPVEGRWSILEVVCHLSDCEQFFADRMKRTIATDRPLLLGAEGGRYPGPLHYHERDIEEEVQLITLTRRQMSRILGLLDSGAWTRTAVHSETGLLTLRQLVLHAIRHQEHHLRFIAEKRRALGVSEA